MKVKRSRYAVILDFLCLVLLVAVVVYLITNWQSIPDQIPGHYDASGAVDRWGGKSELLLLPVIGWILYLMITAVEHFPQVWNTGVKVTEKNRDRVYGTLGDMIATVKLVMVAVFTFLTANSAVARTLPVWFMPVFLVLIFGALAFFIVKLFRTK